MKELKVYKYRSGDDTTFDRDLKSLENDTFWAASKDELNDACEYLISAETLQKQLSDTRNLTNDSKLLNAIVRMKSSLNELLHSRDNTGIYSLSKTQLDELLWAHYANGHRGFCIEYDLDTLMSLYDNDLFSFEIKYCNTPPTLSHNDMNKLDDSKFIYQKLMGIKSIKWKYEKELRIISQEIGFKNYDYRAVKSIYFGIRFPNDKKQSVMKTLKGRKINYFQMTLKPNTYTLFANEIDDLYPTKEKYLYSIAPIGEIATDASLFTGDLEQYKPFIPKIAEIVRREPNCKRVLLIEYSTHKSKPGKPVFFGQYQMNNSKYHNLYLTPEDIDEKFSLIDDL